MSHSIHVTSFTTPACYSFKHIHVPESERTKLSFESFGANFEVTISYVSGPMSDKSSTSLSEIS